MKSALRSTLFFAAIILLAGASSAFADTLKFNFDFSGTGLSSLSTVTTTNTLNGSGAYTILSVVGEINGVSFTGLSSYAGADQFLFLSAPYVDFGGVSFLGANGVAYNIFNSSGTFVINSVTDPSGYYLGIRQPITLRVSPIPEPSTLALLLAGAVAFAGLLLLKKTQA